MPSKNDPVIVLGAGLSGSMMAAYLAKRGFKVEVFERRPDMRKTDISAGKSINLALSVRGLHALEGVGLQKEIMDMVIPMKGRMMHAVDGELTYQPYSKDGETAINSISRGDLNMKLMNLAESYEGVNFHFNQRCVSVDARTGMVSLYDEENENAYTVTGQTIIGADGAFSAARAGLLKSPRFNFSQEYHEAAYKELTIPPTETGGWRMEKNALHIWPRGNFMLIALPNLDGSYTVTLFYPATGKNSFESLVTEDQVLAFFNQYFKDAVELMPELAKDFFENPTGDLVTVRCDPWSWKDKVVLVGDAAHAVVPFFGQGMNAAFEDCAVLDECLDGFDGDWEAVFKKYQAKRVDNGQAIATMAIENYIEMRDKVGDEKWLFRKEIEHLLEKEFPERYLSRYEAVSFTRIPYADAFKLGELNERVLDKVSVGLVDPREVDLKKADEAIREVLKK